LPGNIITFIIRRGVNAVVTIVLMVAMVFMLLHVVAPTPIDLAKLYAPNPRASPQELLLIAKSRGLNLPVYVQFVNYLKGIFTGNLGLDLNGTPVATEIAEYLPLTLTLVIVGLIVGVIIGLYTGAISAANRNTKTDYSIKGVYLVSWAAPPFLVAAILQLVVAYYLHLLPATGAYNLTLYRAPPTRTGFLIIDGILAADWSFELDYIRHLILPAMTIAILNFGVFTRLTRASMVDSLDKEYVKLAYMKGLTKMKVVYGTAFRNALIPVITLIAVYFGLSVGGAVIVEDIFDYRGLGWFTVNAIGNLDYPAVLAITVIVGIGVILANLVADVLYGVADPRVRLS
jgi:peptide/nickel transport system permease protein